MMVNIDADASCRLVASMYLQFGYKWQAHMDYGGKSEKAAEEIADIKVKRNNAAWTHVECGLIAIKFLLVWRRWLKTEIAPLQGRT